MLNDPVNQSDSELQGGQNMYAIHLPLPQKIDPTVTVMQVKVGVVCVIVVFPFLDRGQGGGVVIALMM